MIDFHVVLTACLVCLAGVMSPGPNFVAVTHRAVTATRREALALVAGIACVSMLWSGSALFGLGMLFALFPWLFWTVKLLGGAYLVWLGFRLLRQARQPLATDVDRVAQSKLRDAFRQGLLTNLANPKAMIFYVSVFSAAVPTGATPATLAVVVAGVGAIATAWYGGVAMFLSGTHANRLYRRGKPLIEGACGVFLIGFGLRQVLVRP